MNKFEYKRFLEAVDTVCVNCLKLSEENCEHCAVRFTCDELGKTMKNQKPESWYAIAYCEDSEDCYTHFYKWDTKYGVGYELDTYDELIPNADKCSTLEGAESRAEGVLSTTGDDEVYIVLVHEDEDGDIDYAEFVKAVRRN